MNEGETIAISANDPDVLILVFPGYAGEHLLPDVQLGRHTISRDIDLGSPWGWARPLAASVAGEVQVVHWASGPTLKRIFKFWEAPRRATEAERWFDRMIRDLIVRSPSLWWLFFPYLALHWDRARRDADYTALMCAHELAEETRRTIVIGHSLGGRVALRVREFYPKSDNVPLSIGMAAALSSAEVNWENFSRFAEPAECYWSMHDMMLAFPYNGAGLWLSPALGWCGPPVERNAVLGSIDVSTTKQGSWRDHGDYVPIWGQSLPDDWLELLRRHSVILRPERSTSG